VWSPARYTDRSFQWYFFGDKALWKSPGAFTLVVESLNGLLSAISPATLKAGKRQLRVILHKHYVL